MQSIYQYQIDEQYRKARLNEAERERLAQQTRANRSKANPACAPLLAKLGRRLVNLGEYLQKQYEAADRLVAEF